MSALSVGVVPGVHVDEDTGVFIGKEGQDLGILPWAGKGAGRLPCWASPCPFFLWRAGSSLLSFPKPRPSVIFWLLFLSQNCQVLNLTLTLISPSRLFLLSSPPPRVLPLVGSGESIPKNQG